MVELGLTPDEEGQSEEEFLEEEKASQISTGVREIDDKMGGGIPKGSLTLIEGESSAGKSMTAHQIIWGSLRNELRAAIYTTEHSYKSLITQMDDLSLSVLDRVLLGRLLIFPAQTTRSGWQPTEIFDMLLEDIV
ncbi:MAG: ATPase domain-containing protein, partial [Dehalococcoidia bacterium]